MSFADRVSAERLEALRAALENDRRAGAKHRIRWLEAEIAWVESERRLLKRP